MSLHMLNKLLESRQNSNVKEAKGDEGNGLILSKMPNKWESITKPDSQTEN